MNYSTAGPMRSSPNYQSCFGPVVGVSSLAASLLIYHSW